MKKLTEADALSLFLDALEEWGCENNGERSRSILDFIASGYDLTAYEDRPKLRIIECGRSAKRHLCGCPDFGTYEGQVALVAPDWLKEKWPNGIGIDVCLAREIQALWHAGIRTNGHCCGHGRAAPFISVWPESVSAMQALGYEPYRHPDDRDDHFVPKTKFPAGRAALTEDRDG